MHRRTKKMVQLTLYAYPDEKILIGDGSHAIDWEVWLGLERDRVLQDATRTAEIKRNPANRSQTALFVNDVSIDRVERAAKPR